ncbi:hypothetical protein ACJMK2_032123 [Sinanodonta woodiana]|uniref:HAT C-terminal dimerisation domain-containing protein n=1 Tax=Sinanodonta woodiana TaxID=1069815 RepID=A0ABD3X0T1_SINWO
MLEPNSTAAIDQTWMKISEIRDSIGQAKFGLLAKVMSHILAIPHSNASCERIFSFVRKNRTDFRSSMKTETLESLLVVKQEGIVCYKRQFDKVMLKRCKGTTAMSLQE